MKGIIQLSIICFICLTLFSCTQLTGDKTGVHILDEGTVISIGGIQAIAQADQRYILNGTMKNGGESAHNFRAKLILPEGKSVKLFLYVTKNFTGGAVYQFKRESGKLSLTIDLNGKSHTRELNLSTNKDIVDIDIDFHNDHTDVHFLVWEHVGSHSDKEECSFDGGCLYNSEDFALDDLFEDLWNGIGKASGVYWGLEGDISFIISLEGPLDAISNA